MQGCMSGEMQHGTRLPPQDTFIAHHGLHSGYCIPEMPMTPVELLPANTEQIASAVRDAILENPCLCTGYQAIVDAAFSAANVLARYNEADRA
jgi:aerobic-type carbon monoxide dehydrogenase small subunit (CoxS/CutS family)